MYRQNNSEKLEKGFGAYLDRKLDLDRISYATACLYDELYGSDLFDKVKFITNIGLEFDQELFEMSHEFEMNYRCDGT